MKESIHASVKFTHSFSVITVTSKPNKLQIVFGQIKNLPKSADLVQGFAPRWPKNVTCLVFQLSNQLLLVNKTAELLSSHPISPVNYQYWQLHWIKKSETDHFRFKIWQFSRLVWPKLCNFYFNVWNKCPNFQWLTDHLRSSSKILMSCLLTSADLKTEKLIMKRFFISSLL